MNNNRFYNTIVPSDLQSGGAEDAHLQCAVDCKSTNSISADYKSTGTFGWMNALGRHIGLPILMATLAFTACTEEDLMQPTYSEAGMLHIASVTIDGQDVARTRVVADGGEFAMDELPFNQSFNGFTEGDKLTLKYGFEVLSETAYATLGTDGIWTITSDKEGNTPVTIQPGNGEKWADVTLRAQFFRQPSGLNGNAALTQAQDMGAVQGDIPTNNIYLYADNLIASTDKTNQEEAGITIDTNLNSSTLGATTITLKHQDALLRLPMSAVDVKAGTYIVNGTAYDVTGLGTLWAAVAAANNFTYYYPLTVVKIGEESYLQAIVDLSWNYPLTGFKAVMNVSGGGTLTLDLPFKVGEATTASTGITLEPNHQYPLTLNIAPHTASVTLTDGLGKPGWGTEEEKLSNEQNEIALREATYDANTSTFSVSGAAGLRLVALYINGEVAAGSIAGWPTTDLLKQNITLTADITFPEVGEGESNWTPIGIINTNNDYYQGTIDGGGHTITGMTVNSSEQDMDKRFGLVGNLDITGVVKNLTFKDCTIHGYYGTGLAVGYNYSGLVSNCHAAADCTVTAAYYYAGGIVGTSNGRIVSCTSAATVTANTDCAGGITGSTSSSGIIAACSATGHVSVTATGNTPGGLVGEHYGKMYGCWSTATTGTGDAMTTLDVVGSVGSNNVIKSCYTTATAATHGTSVTAEALNTVTDTATDDDPIELMNAAITTYNSGINDSDAYKKSSKHWASGTTLPVLVDISSTSGE